MKAIRWIDIQLDAGLVTANVQETVMLTDGTTRTLSPTDERRNIEDCSADTQAAIQALAAAFALEAGATAVDSSVAVDARVAAASPQTI